MDILIKNRRPPRCCGICLAEYNFMCGLTDEPKPNNPKFYQNKKIPMIASIPLLARRTERNIHRGILMEESSRLVHKERKEDEDRRNVV